MKKSILLISIILFISCKESEKIEVETTQEPDDIEYVKIEGMSSTDSLKDFTFTDVAKYTIATIMNQSPDIITVTKENELYIVSYTRKSDAKKFIYKIKIEGNKVIWANIDGRWRNHKLDETITFSESEGTLKIKQTFSENSSITKEYKK